MSSVIFVSMFIGIIITLLILFTYKIKRKDKNIKTHDNLKKENIVCSPGSGIWNGSSCICKYPKIVTNNIYNGNCNKVVIKNCRTFYDNKGNLFDFETKNPSTEGVCDCGINFIYDTNAHQCVLRKISNRGLIKSEKKCESGFTYSKQYNLCLKSLCFWDILNPQFIINQKQISETLCACDILKGYIPIKISETIIGCTRALFNQTLPDDTSYILYMTPENGGLLGHFYPQALAGTRLRDYLRNGLSEVDDGTKMVLIVAESVNNLLDELYSRGVVFYTNRFTSLKTPISFKNIVDKIMLLEPNDFNKLSNSTLEPFQPLSLTDLTDNEACALPGSDEIDGETRYRNNLFYYSPVVFDSNKKIVINPEGVNAEVYNYLLLHYHPESNKIIISENFK